MDKYEIVRKIEAFAPLESQEKWDCSGWLVNVSDCENVSKIMLCLTVTDNVIQQAIKQNCDMIISHHPLFYVPLAWKGINIYCAHTNLDKAIGGTTDTLIEKLGLSNYVIDSEFEVIQPFVRYINYEVDINDFIAKLKTISPNLRYVNNNGVQRLKKIAFCAGSGSEFIQEAFKNGADALVTGDLKFHTALESPIVLFDIGHFESEILILPVFARIIGSEAEIIYAKEKSPFLQIKS